MGGLDHVTITYHEGDATQPDLPGCIVIAHIVNDTGAFGAGFASALAARHPLARSRYQAWAQGDRQACARPFRLGAIQWVGVGADLSRTRRFSDRWVVNLVAQHGLGRASHPLQLDALDECLRQLAGCRMPVAMPRIGCGLGGGTWEEVEPVIESALPDDDVHVYDLPGVPVNRRHRGTAMATSVPRAAPTQPEGP